MNVKSEVLSVEEDNLKNTGVDYLLVAWLFATMSLWLFAFYEVPSEELNWVRRAQLACFGSDESGLPNTAGWMLLVLSPALLLLAIVITFSSSFLDTLKSFFTTSTKRFLAGIVILLVVIEASWAFNKIQVRLNSTTIIDPLFSENLPESYPVGQNKAVDFTLTNQYGEIVKLSESLRQPVFLSFIFAHCQSVCPSLVKTLEQTTEKVGVGKAKVLLITLDPWRDTPTSLPTLAKKWKLTKDMQILSGTPEVVNAVLDSYDVPRERDMNNGEVYHPALTYLIDQNGKLVYSFNNASVLWLVEAYNRVSTAHKTEG